MVAIAILAVVAFITELMMSVIMGLSFLTALTLIGSSLAFLFQKEKKDPKIAVAVLIGIVVLLLMSPGF